MEVNEALIRKVAETARLKLTEQEIKEFTPQLKDVLEAFSKLNEMDTDGVEPSQHPISLPGVQREDVITKSISQKEALSLTQHKKDGFFRGPKLQ